MIAPLGAPSIAEAVRAGAQVYARAARDCCTTQGATGLGDEGGFAPDISTPEDVLRTLVGAITDAGYTARPGRRQRSRWTWPRQRVPPGRRRLPRRW